jgi:hypothetical protein
MFLLLVEPTLLIVVSSFVPPTFYSTHPRCRLNGIRYCGSWELFQGALSKIASNKCGAIGKTRGYSFDGVLQNFMWSPEQN